MRTLQQFVAGIFILLCLQFGLVAAQAQSGKKISTPGPQALSVAAAHRMGMFLNETAPVSHPRTQRLITPAQPAGLLTGCGWTASTVYPATILDEAVVTVGSNLYAFAGVSNGVLVTNARKFDGTTWTSIAPLPVALEAPAAVTDGTDIYIIGGANSTGISVNTMYRYNVASNTYTTLAPCTTAAWNSTAAYLNGKIYKIGGTNDVPASLTNVEIYTISSNTWAAGAALPVAESFLNSFVSGNFIYTVGGINAATSVESVKTYRYDPAGNTWDDASIADLSATRWGGASGLYLGSGIVAGGYSAAAVSPTVLAWDPVSNTWSSLPSMTGDRARMGGALLNGSFYVVGGRSTASAGFVGTVENQKLTCVVATSNSDLSITKTDGTTTYTPGGTTTYTIVASNAGPDPATGATVADVLPAFVTSANWTAVYAGGASGPASGAGNINATVNLPVGGTATFTVICNISGAATGIMSNTATVTGPTGAADPNTANNSASDADNSSVISTSCIENFDALIVPSLPSGWTATTSVTCAGTTPWVTSATGSSAPNAATTNDPGCISDEWLDSRTYLIPNSPSILSFKNNYNTESTFDGMVLEISINGGAFTDILTAGGTFVVGGYNGTISLNFNSPIAGRQAWTGTSGGYITTTVSLPASAQGQIVVFRWRRASDSSVAGTGVRLDDIYVIGTATISYPLANYCTTATPATPTITGATGGTFTSAPAGMTINSSTGVITPSTSTPGSYTVTYTLGGGVGCPTSTSTATVNIVAGFNATISYPSGPYCQNGGTANVTQTGTAGGTYSSTAGLTINAATGAVTLGTSTVGTYTVTYTIAASGGCNAFSTTTTITIIVCATGGCIENFEGVTVPALPTGWVATTPTTCATTAAWKTVNTGSFSAPNSAFTNDPACISDERLDSKVYAIPNYPTRLSFRNKYILENGFDGMVLEISINGGAFTDIVTAGGTFVVGAYNGTVSNCCSNPIATRPAWTGTSAGGYIVTTVTLPAAAQGQNVVFRWRRGSDSSVAGTGANIDDVFLVPTATIAYPGSPYCTTGGTATPTVTGAPGGTYTSTAGLSINAATGVVTLGSSVAGTYTVTYTVSLGTGCPTFTTTAPITITGPSATISYAGSPYCSNAGTATVTQTGTAGGTYSSTAGLTINAATGAITLGTSTAGTYTVTYTVAGAVPCAGNYTTTTTVTITAAPSATIAYAGSPYCSSAGTANVTQTGTAGGTYSSTAGLTINAATGAVTLGTSTPGTYTVTYTVAAANGCAQYTTTGSITITAQPAATIAYAGTPYCSSAGTANVTQTGTAGGTYSSTAGLTINAATGAVTLGTSTPGTYTVTYTVAAAGGCAVYTTTTTITITAQPAATIAYAGTPYCSSAGTANVTQTGTAGGTYSSTAGLTINAATGAVTLGTSTPGTYTVTYTVAAAGGCSVYTTTTTITITPQPAATIAYTATPYCTNGGTGTVTQTGTTGGTYSAAPAGLSINATTGTITLATSTVGTYTVTYTVAAAGGCSVYTTTTTITINAPSVAPTSATASNPNMCTPGGTTDLTEVGGTLGTGASYKWYAGSCGGTPIGTGATLTGISVTATTTFYVRAEGICGNTACASVTVTVNPTPTVILTVASGFPGPGQTNPGNPSGLYTTVSPAGNYNYVWTLNGNVISATGPTITPANGLFTDFGTYVVTATNTATGCFASSNAVTVTDIVGQRGQLFITPNPAHSSIDIHYYSSTTGTQARTVSLYTATGQRLMNVAYTPSGTYGNMTLDISMLPKGTYIVVLFDGANKKIASAGLVKL